MRAEIPLEEGVSVAPIDGGLEFKGPKGSSVWKNPIFGLKYEVNNNKVVLEHDDLKYLNTAKALIKNKMKGVKEGFSRVMVIRYSHFPIKVKVVGKDIIIENFYGERAPRKAKIVGDTQVEIKGEKIFVRGIDKYEVGQTAANIREATKLHGRRRKDIRRMQDGIYFSLEG